MIDLTESIKMEVGDNEWNDDEDVGDEVHNAKDVELLWSTGLSILTCMIVMMKLTIQLIPIKMIISNTCMIRTY